MVRDPGETYTQYQRRESNPYDHKDQRFLRPPRIPIPPLWHFIVGTTGIEPMPPDLQSGALSFRKTKLRYIPITASL